MGGFDPKLQLKVTQKQILTPSLVQMVSLLQLNRLELRQMIEQELMQNPVLEEIGEDGLPREREATDDGFESAESEPPREEAADPYEDFDVNAIFEEYADATERRQEREDIERPAFENFVSPPTTLTDHLEWQLSLSVAPEEVKAAASSIIGNLNEDGYLTATLEEIAQSGEHELAHVEQALKLVQEFDPLGVAARDLQECLLLQLRTLEPENTLAQQIVADHLKQLQNKQYREISRALNRPLPAVLLAVEVIKRCDPRPGLRYNRTQATPIEPDVFFVKVGNEYQVLLSEDDLPQLRLSPLYRRLLDRRAAPAEVRNYVKERFASAVQLLKNIQQRKHTIQRVCEIICERQRDFLDHGLDHMKPLMIKEVAEQVGVHPSTVSRAVANKYAYTPQGVIELRRFFSEAVGGPAGQMTALLTVKRRVKKMIEEEDPEHPLTDEQIAQRLAAEGIQVTRRTVAKYREDMRIPSTHQRRAKL
ncbi:MAG TPA: RNA polymerase factor sigma-54 [Candidatus Xenobia bacterium]|nr:RNA polymerase factor sigma-54 [Candidatus Xenobia bacterium]